MRTLALFGLLAVTGATHAAAPVPSAQFAVRWTEQAYMARHATLLSAAEGFRAASEALCAAPSAAALDRARARWSETMLAWRRMDGAPAAPVVLARTGRLIDFRPTRVKDVEARIARGEGPDPANVAVRGIGTAEYLLWGDDAPAAQLAALATPARCAYLQGVAARIAEDIHGSDEDWLQHVIKLGGEVDFPRRNVLAENLGFMLGGLEGVARRIPKVREARPDAWPDWRSRSTGAAITAQLEGFAFAYAGPPGRPDASLSAFVREQGHAQADERVRAALERVLEAARNLPSASRPASVTDYAVLLDALAALRRSVETLAIELDLVLGFNDSDGD